MLDALIGEILEMVLTLVGAAIVKLFGVDNALEITGVVVGLGFLGIGVGIAVWGH
jgi:hypothetical protein